MRIAVDHVRCAGLGLCEALAPDVFEVGDDGFLALRSETVPDGGGLADAVGQAVDNCPTGALSVAP